MDGPKEEGWIDDLILSLKDLLFYDNDADFIHFPPTTPFLNFHLSGACET